MMELELTSADIPGVLDAMTGAGIRIYGSAPVDPLTLRIRISRRDYQKSAALCEKRGDTLRLRGKRGIFWTVSALLKRPVLLLGAFIMLFLVLTIPTRVFFIRVEGNASIPTNRILEAAGESGICFGASRREVRSEQMKNNLLEAVPELKWAGVNTYGCVAVITVRERAIPETVEEPGGVSSMVAACDGVIISATATSGNLLCQPGQAVVAGQVLISGYRDCGLCLQAGTAEGEIIARTKHELTAVTPVTASKRGQVQEQTVNYSLLIGKKRINLWKDSGIWDGSCGRMYEEYYITLPGGFQLPVAVVKETVIRYDIAAVDSEPPEALLSDFAEDYLLQQLIAGTIEGRNTKFRRLGDVYLLEGSYLCTEMIGRQRQEQIGETHGKDN